MNDCKTTKAFCRWLKRNAGRKLDYIAAIVRAA